MIKNGYNNTSKSESWNVLETVMSHLKSENFTTVKMTYSVTNYNVPQQQDT